MSTPTKNSPTSMPPNWSPAYAGHVFLRRQQVELITGLPRSTLYRKIAEGHFPAPFKIGRRASGWRAADVAAWAEACQKAA